MGSAYNPDGKSALVSHTTFWPAKWGRSKGRAKWRGRTTGLLHSSLFRKPEPAYEQHAIHEQAVGG